MKGKDQQQPPDLGAVVGTNLARLRRARGWGQEDLAMAARAVGLGWTRTRVTAIEAGREVLSLGEALLIQGVLGAGLGEIVDPRPGHGAKDVRIEGIRVSRSAVLDLARGEPRSLPRLAPKSVSIGLSDPRLRRLSQLAAMYQVPPDIRLLMASLAEAEKKAARRLGELGVDTDPLEIAVASASLWGRGLAQERDRRLRLDQIDTPTRGLRGHVTRHLLQELAEAIRQRSSDSV